MDDFETMLNAHRVSIECYVRYRLPSGSDADDILQEVYLTAYQKFSQLKNHASFKAWLISIAKNKVNDYYRRKAVQLEIPLDSLTEKELTETSYGLAERYIVRETLELLGDKDKQILYLYYWKDMPQAEIAKQLDISVGTVKSRLHTAKQNFRNKYPYQPDLSKGEYNMKKMPEFIPEYTIEPSTQAPFSVKWEELIGWFLVPKPGEKLSWGLYDIPSRRCSHVCEMQVTGKAKVHGIEGVELTAREAPYSHKQEVTHRTFVVQLTETHCRYLAVMQTDNNIRNYITFLDGDEFMSTWGFGEDNCGSETNLSRKGDIQRSGNIITSVNKTFLLDIVGRYTVTINGKSFDTVCIMDLSPEHCGVVSEQFLDQNGRTILWRRFNRDDWAIHRYQKKWSEQLPQNQQLTINGSTYVHWYDCITDYIL